MPFASALSEHPVASAAVGEVCGAVLEAGGDRPDLVLLTATRSHAGALEDIVGTVLAVLHPLALVGAVAESVVGTAREVEETVAISLWAGWVGPLAPVRLTATSLADGSWHFAGWPEHLGFEPTALVLLADPFTFPAKPFLGWLAEHHPGLPAVGGNASGGRGPGGSRLVVAGGAMGAGAWSGGTVAGGAVASGAVAGGAVAGGVVAAGAVGVLVGGGVDIETLVSQGCRPYGDALTVTRSERNIIHEVAGRPALECLVEQTSHHLDPVAMAGIEANGLFVGRVVDARVTEPAPADYLVRSVVGVDRATGAVAVDDQVPLGSTIRFHRRDAETAHRDLAQLLEGRQADAGLLFTGSGRGTRLFEDAHHDARAVAYGVGGVPVGGLFAGGEFGPVGGHNFVHRFTTSLALFRSHE